MGKQTGATGDGWQAAQSWLENTKRDLPRIAGVVDQAIHEKIAEVARDLIRQGRIAPPSGNGGNTLMDTEEYVDRIAAFQNADGSWRVGLPDEQHPRGDVNLQDLYVYLEYGTSRMPARPHIGAAGRSVLATGQIGAILIAMGFELRG